MSELVHYREKLKGIRAEFDPAAWEQMKSMLDTKPVARPNARRWGLSLFSIAFSGLLLSGLVSDSPSLTLGQEKPVKQDLGQPQQEVTTGIVSQVEEAIVVYDSLEHTVYFPAPAKAEESGIINEEPNGQAERAGIAERPARQLLTQQETVFSSTESALNKKGLNRQTDPFGLVMDMAFLKAPLVSLTHYRGDSVGTVPIEYAEPEPKPRFPAWNFFLTAGITAGQGAARQGSLGSFGDVVFAGGGFKITERSFFQATFGEGYHKFGFAYLLGNGRWKFGPEINLLVVGQALGPTLGMGAYYHTSQRMRLFAKWSNTNYRFFGEDELSIAEITFGVQVRILKEWARKRKRIIPGKTIGVAGKYNPLDDGDWKWFASGYLDLGHFLGYGGNAGIDIGRYLGPKRFVQLGARFPLRGYIHSTSFDPTERFGIEANYNFLIGTYRIYGLVQAGLLLVSDGQGLFARDDSPGSLQPNLGLGGLYKFRNNTRFYILGNLYEPYSSAEFARRFSIQVGAQFRL